MLICELLINIILTLSAKSENDYNVLLYLKKQLSLSKNLINIINNI